MILLKAWNWLRRVPHERGYISLLLAVNLLGTVYGFYWYRHQLRETSPLYWLVVPDSPTATLFFALFLATLLRREARRDEPGAGGERKRNGSRGVASLIRGMAYLSNVKYGLWTPAVMAHYWIAAGSMDFESMHLTLSHLGMALQSVLFAPLHPAPVWAVLAAAAWLVFNDVADYLFGFHPYLPLPGGEGFAAAAAFSLTFLSLWFFLVSHHKQ